MATSSITEPFYCEDPKAVNVLIHALFTESKPSNRRASVKLAEFASRKDEVSFIRKMQRRWAACHKAG